jgi:hypothetical protein
MEQDSFDYAGTYSSMTDEELLELAGDSANLVDSAQAALRKELDSRGLKPGLEPGKGSPEDPDSAFYCPSCERKVKDPLTCGDCSAIICRVCGTPLKMPEEVDAEEIET